MMPPPGYQRISNGRRTCCQVHFKCTCGRVSRHIGRRSDAVAFCFHIVSQKCLWNSWLWDTKSYVTLIAWNKLLNFIKHIFWYFAVFWNSFSKYLLLFNTLYFDASARFCVRCIFPEFFKKVKKWLSFIVGFLVEKVSNFTLLHYFFEISVYSEG